MATPAHDRLEAMVYRIGWSIAATFQDAETRLLVEIARRVGRSIDAGDEIGQLRQIRELELFAQEATANLTPEAAREIVAEAAREGVAATVRARLPRIGTTTALADSQVLAAVLTAAELGNAFTDARTRILRYPRDAFGALMPGGDVYQQVIARFAAGVPLGASTAAARKSATIDFLARGITGITDSAGRSWRVGSYAEMATRTAVARAYRQASTFQAEQNGVELFAPQGGRNSCQQCAQWFGKILASTGPTGRREVQHAYEDRIAVVTVAETVSGWYASGAGHPNCACVLAPFLPGFAIPAAAREHDPQARADRDRLRALEVRIRDAKRKLDIADVLGDEEVVRRQTLRVRGLRQAIRDHVAATGQRRRYDREQVAFSDGP